MKDVQDKSKKAPSPPVSERERDQVNREFNVMHVSALTRIAEWRSPWSVCAGDLASRVHERFDRAYCNDGEFCAWVRANGVAKVRDHLFWANWFNWESTNLSREHYGAIPKSTTHAEDLFLRLAAGRYDRRLFPLVGDQVSPKERTLLNQLIREGKICEVPAVERVSVWKQDANLSLRLTDKRDKKGGGGDAMLETLVVRGYFRKCRTDDPSRMWRYEPDKETGENVAVTLELTRTGQWYLDELSHPHIALGEDCGDDEIDTDVENLPGDDLSGDNSSPEAIARNCDAALAILGGTDWLSRILDHAVTAGEKPRIRAEAFKLWMTGEAPGDNPWTLKRVADRIGKSKTTVERWVKEDYEWLTYHPGAQEFLLEIIRKSKEQNN